MADMDIYIPIVKYDKPRSTKSGAYESQKKDLDGGNMIDASRTGLYSYANIGEMSPGSYSPGSSNGLYDTRFASPVDDSVMNGFDESLRGSSTYKTLSSDGSGEVSTEQAYISYEKSRIARQKNSRDWSRSDHFAIGTVCLSIPPTQISVSNEAHNYRYSTLRSPGEVVLSSGRSTTRVDLDIVFNGLDDVNEKLRPLLAQFKTTPFLPIESEYLKDILNPFNVGSSRTIYEDSLKQQYKDMSKGDLVVKQLLDLSAKKDVKGNEIMEVINKMHSDNYIDDDFIGKLRMFVRDPQSIPKSELSEEDYRSDGTVDLDHWIRRNITIPGVRDINMVSVERDLNEIKAVREEIDILNQMSTEAQFVGIEGVFQDRQIVCALSQMSVSTVPGLPETLSCRLSLYVFNYDPYSLDFSFILGYDRNASTPDITKCDLFIDWYTKRWLMGDKDIETPGLKQYDGNQAMSFSYFSRISPVSSAGIWNKEDFQTEFMTVGDGMIITGITVSIKNVIQFLPILSCKNPTCQYLGSMNSEVSINFECTNSIKVRELSRMMERVATTSRTVNRVSRANYIYIENNFTLLFGMPFFTIDNYSIDTVPGSPGLYSINVALIEYKVGQERFQQLVREGITSQKEVEFVAKFALEEAHKFSTGATTDRYYYDKVCHPKTGWFNNITDPVAQFVQGDFANSGEFKQLVGQVKLRSKDLALEYTPIVPNYSPIYAVPYSPSGGYDPIIAKAMAQNVQYLQFGKKFASSLRNPHQDSNNFYFSNVDLVSKVLGVMRRDDLVSMILLDEQKSKIGALLNKAVDSSGRPIRNKEDQDSAKQFCYPDLELPRYGDLPNGYMYKITLAENGMTGKESERDMSIQSDEAEVDPDFYMFRGSLWGTMESKFPSKTIADPGITLYKRMAETNKEYRRTEALDESIAADFLSQTRKRDTEDRLFNGKITIEPGLKDKMSGTLLKVIRVKDGDTIVLSVDGRDVDVRILGYDALETKKSDSKSVTDLNRALATKRELEMLIGGSSVYVDLSSNEKDSYGRVLANVVTADGRNVSMEMLSKHKELGIIPMSGADNPLSAEAEEVYMKSHEIYIRTVLNKSFVQKAFEVLTYNPTIAFISSKFGGNVVSAFGATSKAGGLLDNFLNVSNKTSAQLSRETEDDVAIALGAAIKTLPKWITYSIFPENTVTNNVVDTIAEALSQRTNNKGLSRYSGVVDREGNSVIDGISKKVRESQKDDTWRMSRAFPTFKVYFIEEDMPEWGRLDDLYSYHAVASIDITRSRQDPADVAVLSLFNTRGVLDRSLFGLHSPDGILFPRGKDENYETRKQETRLEQELEEFILKPGTLIKIKMGYSSDPDLLDTVFTGMVAEVSGGDIINIVAQGFGVELLQPVPFTSKMISSAGASKVLNQIITDPVVKHFGKTEWFPYTDDTSKTIYRRSKFNPKTREWESKSWWRRIAGLNYILRLRDDTADNNIWVKEIGVWYSLSHGGYQNLILKDRTIWDVFREMQRRYPGNIAAVLPFDNRATVYFGPSEFMYTYTAEKDDAKRVWNNKYLDRIDKSKDLRVGVLVDEYGYQKLDDAQASKEAAELTQLFNSLYNVSLKDSSDRDRNFDILIKSMNGEDTVYIKTAIAFLRTTASAYSYIKNSPENEANKKRLELIAKSLEEGRSSPFAVHVSVPFSNQNSGRNIRRNFTVVHLKSGDIYLSPRGDRYDYEGAVESYDTTVTDEFLSSNPSRKLVRSYHYKDSYHHIVANNIVATSQYLYNKVTVEWGDEKSWINPTTLLTGAAGFGRISAQIDDDIWPERIKEKIVQEKNADNIITAWHYALGGLWEEARKMYGGHLTLLGDASIKPNDIVMISDYFTDMYGPIEVEQVTHHFSPDTGFVTTVVPNLVCNVNNPLQQSSLTVAGTYMDASSEFVQNVRSAFSVATPLVGNLFAGIAFWMSSLTRSRREPISLTPLIYSGRPYVAGIEGMRMNNLVEAVAGKITRFKIQTKRILGTGGSMLEYLRMRASNRNDAILKSALTEAGIR